MLFFAADRKLVHESRGHNGPGISRTRGLRDCRMLKDADLQSAQAPERAGGVLPEISVRASELGFKKQHGWSQT
ncbi:hypothetical protein BDW60DRAFT_170677 [Aspergillus nidulans var. acristatus]